MNHKAVDTRLNVVEHSGRVRCAILFSFLCFAAILSICSGCGTSKPSASTPEDAYREFLLATLDGNEKTIRPLIVDSDGADILWQGAYPKEVAPLLAQQYRTMEIT